MVGGKGSETAAGENQVAVAAADKHNEIIASVLSSLPLAPLQLKRDRRRLLVIRLPPRMDELHAWNIVGEINNMAYKSYNIVISRLHQS